MKCLVSPLSYFGATRLSLAWIKMRCPTPSQLWARKVDEIRQWHSPAFCAGPSNCLWWARAERVAGHRLYKVPLPAAGELAADSLPPSQLPRQHLSLGMIGGVGCCLFALLLEAVWALLGREGRELRTALLISTERSRTAYMAYWRHRYLGHRLLKLLTDTLG